MRDAVSSVFTLHRFVLNQTKLLERLIEIDEIGSALVFQGRRFENETVSRLRLLRFKYRCVVGVGLDNVKNREDASGHGLPSGPHANACWEDPKKRDRADPMRPFLHRLPAQIGNRQSG